MSILDKHNNVYRNRFIQAHLFQKKSNVRQAKFRISISICVIKTQLLLDARIRYSYNAHRRLWSDCASVIRLHLAHMYFVKYCVNGAYKCQPSSFYGHTNPAHIVTSCYKRGCGCRQTDEVILYCFNSAKACVTPIL